MTIRIWFDELSEESIDELIRDKQEENLHLDFKTINSPELDADDRRNLAIAISGFANAEGGLIVWGVDARRNREGIDCANGRRNIPDLSRFISRLNNVSSDAMNHPGFSGDSFS